MKHLRLLRCAVLLGAFFCWSRAALAEEKIPDDFTGSPIDGEVLKQEPEARYKALMEAATREPIDLDKLDEYRKTFWDTYPDKPGHKEARETLAIALYLKDMMYLRGSLFFRVIDSDYREMQRKGEAAAVSQLVNYLGGNIDGGIPQVAFVACMDWVDETTRRLGPARSNDDIFKKGLSVGLGPLSPRLRSAANVSGKEYQAYLMLRDWAEYDRIGKVPAGFDNRENYGIYIYCRMAHYPFTAARDVYAGFVQVMGKKSAEDAADAVRSAEHVDAETLKTSVPRPVKRGPGGGEVDDYDVPYPPGVIGVYSSPPMAMEMQATEGNDEHYALKLLSGRFVDDHLFPPALREKSGTNKWLWARSMLTAMNNAFGADQVDGAAKAVHSAKKRLITGSVMNQEALGAKRNAPLECLEDILCRKNPRGYLLCAIAMKAAPFDPGSVNLSAAYQGAIARDDERKLLASAAQWAEYKPNLGYMLELDGIKDAIGRPQVVENTGPMIEFPPYLDWRRFPVGAQVAYVQRLWIGNPLVSETLTPRAWPDLKYMYTVKSVTPEQVNLWHTEQVFDWQNGAAHPPRDTEIAYPAKVPAPAPTSAATGDSKSGQMRTRDQAEARIERIGGQAGTPMEESGEETLVVGGRQLRCKWTSRTVTSSTEGSMTKTWTCDDIPGGLVRKLADRVYRGDRGHPPSRSVTDTYLASFKGFEPGTPAADPKQTLPPPGPPVPALAALLPKPRPPQPIVNSTFNPNMRGDPTTSPTAPAPTAPIARPRATSQPSDRQTALRLRYNADLTRLRQDTMQVAQKRRETRTIPPDIIEAQQAVTVKFGEVSRALASRDDERTAKALDDLEQALGVLEERLK